MKRALGIAAATTFTVVGLAGPASAEKPADPGCFGQDRAYFAQQMGSDWGQEASNRAGTNGDMNRAYRAGPWCGVFS